MSFFRETIVPALTAGAIVFPLAAVFDATAGYAHPDAAKETVESAPQQNEKPKEFTLPNGQRCFVANSKKLFCTDERGAFRPR
jgi:hypothetical protein